MTQLLQRALDEVQKLPDAEQDAIAERILAELADERQWDEAFAKSQNVIERLADKARDKVRSSLTPRMDSTDCE